MIRVKRYSGVLLDVRVGTVTLMLQRQGSQIVSVVVEAYAEWSR